MTEVSTAVLVLDFQNEFLKEGGKLYATVKDMIESTGLLKKVPAFVSEAREQGAMVIYAPVKMKKDSGQKFQEVDDPNAYDNMIGLFEEGTWNSEIVTELAPHKDDIILVGRNNYSAFQGTDLKQVLERNGVQRLFITGLLTDVCVANTAQDADEFLDGKTQVYVLKDGCCAETQQRHNDTLQFALPMFADIISCQKGLEEIRRNRSTKSLKKTEAIAAKPIDSLKPTRAKKRFTMFDQVKRLRLAMIDKWVAGDRFVRFLDRDGDGMVDYDEFYDFLHQFGLVQETKVDPKQVFDILDTSGTGEISVQDLLDALTVDDGDLDTTPVAELDQLPPFPSPFLVGLVAHNNMKPSMMKFVKDNISFFSRVKLVTTGSTGRALSSLGLGVEHLVSSGPLGGDQEIGGLISEGKVVAVFFFTDPLSAHPHAADISALNRICCVHDTMFANNPSSAKCLVWSLENSVFGYSRLVGVNPDIGKDADVVEKYKEGQAKVIQAVSVENK